MLQGWVIVAVSFAYLGVLFAIAYYGDKRAEAGRSIIANPYIYAFSLAVYCTTWTFYGSVGRAASSGIGFLPVYLGPTLMVPLWWYVMRKILRISKAYRITSIADFVASRYGKSQLLGGLVTVIAVLGVIPYISLQLKAISGSFTILLHYPDIVMPGKALAQPFLRDSALYIAMMLAAFTILFGTRHLDATERHEGLVAAIAFESVVKLLAFLVVGAFVTFGIYRGFGDVFHQAERLASLRGLLTVPSTSGSYVTWAFLTLLSMLSIMFLPRQFQISVVENVDEDHLGKAIWLFPLYLLLINVFVLPVAIGGLILFAGAGVDADTFVLTLPMSQQREALTLFAFIGGLSAGTGMVIVETIALSTMVCNDLVMPVLLADEVAAPQRVAGRLGAAPLDPPPRDRRDHAPRVRLLPRGRRGLRARRDRPHLLRGGGAVRAGDPRRHLLARRHPRRRVRGPLRRFRGVGVHAAPALLRQVGLAARELPHRRPPRRRAAEAAAALRPHGHGRDPARPVLEHARQRRPLRGRVGGDAAGGRGDQPGSPVRGRLRAHARVRSLAALARQRLGAGSPPPHRALPRAGAGARGVPRVRAAARLRLARRAPRRRRIWSTSRRRSSPAPSEAPPRASSSPPSCRRSRPGSTR